MQKKMKITEYTEEEQIVILEFPYIQMHKPNQIILIQLIFKIVLNQETPKLLLRFQIQISLTIIKKYI
jgi:hypothetical protein